MAKIDRNQGVEVIAAIISDELEKAGLVAVLSGGSVVTIYSDNRYESPDLDFVTQETIRDIAQVMQRLGFVAKSRRHFEHPNCNYLVEFPAGPLAIGDVPVREWARLETPAGTIQILTPTQCVMDRLAAFYHWNDHAALDQAVMVATNQEIDLAEVRRWSESENQLSKFEEFNAAIDNEK